MEVNLESILEISFGLRLMVKFGVNLEINFGLHFGGGFIISLMLSLIEIGSKNNCAPVAQMDSQHRSSKAGVPGSSPGGRAIYFIVDIFV